MVTSFALADTHSLGDLKVFLGRAARVDQGSVRLIGAAGVLAVYSPVLYPKGLLDDAPTVLGLRTFALAETTAFDVAVPVRAMLDRLALLSLTLNSDAGSVDVPLPPMEQSPAWVGISPPRGGWERVGAVDQSVLRAAAAAGIAEVAAAVPSGIGEQLVHTVRKGVWGRAIDGTEPPLAAGVAFAADSLGFLGGEEPANVFRSGPWTRVTTKRGHILSR